MSYQVLARKYRPKNFSQLKGQDSLIRIIINAIKRNQLANAYLFSGIRGIGKTTTARIIAKTINCSDKQVSESIITPCEKCPNCLAMNSLSHPDVVELDAASKTGVDDVREIIESTQFKPILGTYKIYVIDEIHMLSNNAFNALLKTLEEPPENLIFIFATTEIRKIPLTVISRCQKLSLNRLSKLKMCDHLKDICDKESIKIDASGLDALSNFSDGSVRDALSMLETINMYKDDGEVISAELVSAALGMPSCDNTYEILNSIISGQTESVIHSIRKLYSQGMDAAIILENVLGATSKVSKCIAAKNILDSMDISDHERQLLDNTSAKTTLEKITTIWKMLFKGVEEIKVLGDSINTLEILAIRVCHLSLLPSIESVLKNSNLNTLNSTPDRDVNARKDLPATPIQLGEEREHTAMFKNGDKYNSSLNESHLELSTSSNVEEKSAICEVTTFKDVVKLFFKHKELILYNYLIEDVNLVSYKPGIIEARVATYVPKDFIQKVIKHLDEWTRLKWKFISSNNSDKSQDSVKNQEFNAAQDSALVKSTLEAFPGAKIQSVSSVK